MKSWCHYKQCGYYIKERLYNNCGRNAWADGPFMLKEIGAMMGISKQRVAQIQNSAKKKLENNGYNPLTEY